MESTKTMLHKMTLYILIFILGFILISLWNFYSVIRPPHIKISYTPEIFNLPSENITVTTKDGVRLSGWLIENEVTKEKKRALIILHGYPVEKGDMLPIASNLYPDFTLLLLDQRYFGESGGAFTTFGIKEREDMGAVLDLLASRGYEKIGVFGFSLGGAVGIMSAASDTRIDAVASYASHADVARLGEETYRQLFILKKPMIGLMSLWGRLLFGESLKKISPVNAAQELEIPILIIHSEDDDQISFAHAKALQEALSNNEKAEFYFFKGWLHGELPGDFENKLKDFFLRSL